MDVKGKGEKVWRHDHEGKNGAFYTYTVRVKKQREDGTWASIYMPIAFAKKANAPEKISNGAKIDFDGFFTIDEYNDDKRLMIIAMSMKVVEEAKEGDKDIPDSFALAEEECTF